MTREWYMHPNGQLPGVRVGLRRRQPAGARAGGARRVPASTARRDRDWLARIFHKLLLGFTWWANRQGPRGQPLFGGGFLGLDNVGPFDRSAPLPDGLRARAGRRHRLDGHLLPDLLEIAIVLAEEDPAYEDVAVKFFEHFTMIARPSTSTACGTRRTASTTTASAAPTARRAGAGPVDGRAASRCCAVADRHPAMLGAAARVPRAGRRVPRTRGPSTPPAVRRSARRAPRDGARARAAATACARCSRTCSTRTSSCRRTACARCRPTTATSRTRSTLAARRTAVDYEPARVDAPACSAATPTGAGRCGSPSTTSSSARCCASTGSSATTSPSSSRPGRAAAHAAARSPTTSRERLIALFLPRRRRHAARVRRRRAASQTDPALARALLFHEYFHGDTGAGLGRLAPDRLDRPGRRPHRSACSWAREQA